MGLRSILRGTAASRSARTRTEDSRRLPSLWRGRWPHRDSGGHESVIGEGGVQWMTSGRGVVHEEISPKEFLDLGGLLKILQLWVAVL